ncbi:MarR family winged helix-turn-helix transcriptional regulator [Roseovarius aestuariivivens]|uniref:MarR family winged helix-turn-helix transcriptional regulator n=1 Tax=Roseovarius aestuariivivens TaxID=1888910 RepID=UPI001436B6A7|nr:MarR family transcriptional regulator [Roseovarius aestuariivivens]
MIEPVPQHSRTWRAIARAYIKGREQIDTALKLENLPPLEIFEALSAINAGTHGAKALENDLLMPQYAVSRLLDRMERDMLISRMPNPDDQRAKTVEVTRRGQSVLAEQAGVYADAVASFMAPRAKPGQLERMTDLLSLLDRDEPET